MQKQCSDLFEAISEQERMDASSIRRGLDAFVVAQDEAKEALIQVLMDGLMHPCRDQGVLGAVFLSGPTGVGKTELARALAHTLFGDPDGFTYISAETMTHPADVSILK